MQLATTYIPESDAHLDATIRAVCAEMSAGNLAPADVADWAEATYEALLAAVIAGRVPAGDRVTAFLLGMARAVTIGG